MNRSDLRSRVRALTNIYSTSLLSDAQINDALQEQYSRITMMSHWPFVTESTVITTVPGTADYSLPADTFEVLSVSARSTTSSQRTLSPVTVFDTEVAARAGDSQAPVFYMDTPGAATPAITLMPTPAAAEQITVITTRRAAALDGDTDVPEFLEEFHPVVAYAAAAMLMAERRADTQKVATLEQTAGLYLDRMRRFYLTSADHSPIRAGIGRWQRWGRWRASI